MGGSGRKKGDREVQKQGKWGAVEELGPWNHWILRPALPLNEEAGTGGSLPGPQSTVRC